MLVSNTLFLLSREGILLRGDISVIFVFDLGSSLDVRCGEEIPKMDLMSLNIKEITFQAHT